MTEQERKWYVVRTLSGNEKKVKQYLENAIAQKKFGDSISQVIVPAEKVYQIRKGKKINKEKNFFPGYVIIEAVLDAETISKIKEIPGVSGLLGVYKKIQKVYKDGTNEFSEKPKTKTEVVFVPTPLLPSEISKILGKMDQLLEAEEKNIEPFIVGETVKIIDGPFNSFIGTIEEIYDDKKRLKVMVKIFGRNTPLELSFQQVEKQS